MYKAYHLSALPYSLILILTQNYDETTNIFFLQMRTAGHWEANFTQLTKWKDQDTNGGYLAPESLSQIKNTEGTWNNTMCIPKEKSC